MYLYALRRDGTHSNISATKIKKKKLKRDRVIEREGIR